MTKKCICRELNLSNSTEFYGHFIFTSLEAGEGITLGNMIRRTLLSSLIGSKIVGVKISNVTHEFSEIEGVREDILEILLNLKEVIIKNNIGHPFCYGKINLRGPCIVTAGSFILPDGLKILNPHHYLFTISEEISFNLEVKIELGKSYVLATDRKLDQLGEFFPIDANFTPIINVDYHIQSILDYAEQSFEELHLIIYTNGTLLPQEALLLAANNLSRLLLSCRSVEPITLSNKTSESLLLNKNKSELYKTSLRNKNRETPKNFLRNTKKSLSNSILKNDVKSLDSFTQISSAKTIGNELKTPQEYQTNKTLDGKSIITKIDHIIPNGKEIQRPLNKYESQKWKLNQPNSKLEINSNIIQTSTKTLDLKTIDIEITCLPNRIIVILRNAKINVMSELLKYSLLDLQQIKGLGPISVKKIKTQVDLFFEAISL